MNTHQFPLAGVDDEREYPVKVDFVEGVLNMNEREVVVTQRYG